MSQPFSSERPLRVAVIGSGPSGLYAAEALIKQQALPVSVDVIDRLPTPYGLVRYGVAPDHQKIKSVTTLYQKVLEDPRVRFFGHVEFGKDLTLDDLKRHYDAVVYAVGASSDRTLDIPGEQLEGSLSATEFVAWYNGHPDAEAREMVLTASGVAVVGVGNVAVDVTRILAKTTEELAVTDIADYALSALSRSPVTDIYVLGRRGPAQAKFTTKELRELGELTGADIVVKNEEVALSSEEEAAITDNTVRKNVEVLREFAQKPLTGKPRRVHLRFLVSPVEVLGNGRVEGLRIERNRLDAQHNAVGTGEFETLDVQMILRSVGYRGVALPGVPFDGRKGVIPNENGRVTEDGQARVGEYVAGWIKRGPSGVIGTNKACAVDSVKLLLADAPTLPRAERADPEVVVELLRQRGVDYVTLNEWLLIDRHEQELGKSQGRPRVKVVRRDEFLGLIRRGRDAS
ncbi:FAD-dependent oxidoreductase [Deinococcus peraridilitoris]|uniref:NADPH-dependent glutamate synthase beta chain-like oxidoreductase n=1 Tax=Deinococcus peraridilitoris (strain DSM 19664 / LMG 22246 / CIP 109416 / KR-200) TaxID=937777 RepID=K9ZW79_DEIPD|nr:FAD-dependent oxidoreductase [Deinococcus peraridilitoris]AFZ65898.1 NADPH-dependent glutamate synthase beta chain-like oxidoreductase [Deinococcus peraridilitoris DSM 19664]